MEYSIKQAASLFGMSDNGVRFLEKKGITQPQRDDFSGYRHYKEDDLLLLTLYKAYKADGLELSDIQEILRKPANEVSQLLDEHLTAIKKHVAEIEQNVEVTKELLSHVSENPICDIKDRPHFAFFTTHRDEFAQLVHHSTSTEIATDYQSWVGLSPLTTCAIRYAVSNDGLQYDTVDMQGLRMYYARGYLIEWNHFIDSGIDINDYIIDYPALSRCFYVSLSYPNTTGDDEALGMLLDLLDKNVHGAVPCGTILGRLLNARMTDDGLIYYAEYWIPFEQR